MQEVHRIQSPVPATYSKQNTDFWRPWVWGLLVLALTPDAMAYDVQLAVTYNTPGIEYGPVSFGLASLPVTVESTFVFDTNSLVQVDDDVYSVGLDGISSAHVAFGSGEWTQLAEFELIVEFVDGGNFAGPVDFIDLHYGFQPIAPTGVANGIVFNSSFVLSVSGTDTASGDDFLYGYSGSTQSLEPTDADGDGVLNADDFCAETAIPESVPTSGTLLNSQHALISSEPDDDGFVFFSSTSKTKFTTTDTGGCSCEQIVDALQLGKGGLKFGCSQGQMKAWVLNLP